MSASKATHTNLCAGDAEIDASHPKALKTTDRFESKEEYADGSSDEGANLFEGKDLLFDEHADSEDDQWVKDSMLVGPSTEPSDSISCPSCFSLLSMQCQQHTRYQSQFRALFVVNCSTDKKETLHAKKNSHHGNASHKEEQCFLPVKCEKCGTRVAVLDESGVYHFFNVVY